MVVGSGHSAFNAILDLVALRDSEPATQIVWAIRGGAPGRKYGGGGADQLPARGALGNAVRSLVEDGSIALDPGLSDPRGGRPPADGSCCATASAWSSGDEVIARDRLPARPDAAAASCGSTSTIASRPPARLLR